MRRCAALRTAFLLVFLFPPYPHKFHVLTSYPMTSRKFLLTSARARHRNISWTRVREKAWDIAKSVVKRKLQQPPRSPPWQGRSREQVLNHWTPFAPKSRPCRHRALRYHSLWGTLAWTMELDPVLALLDQLLPPKLKEKVYIAANRVLACWQTLTNSTFILFCSVLFLDCGFSDYWIWDAHLKQQKEAFQRFKP